MTEFASFMRPLCSESERLCTVRIGARRFLLRSRDAQAILQLPDWNRAQPSSKRPPLKFSFPPEFVL